MSTQYDPGNYNRSGMIVFITSMVATLVFFIYVAFIHSGVDLKEIPKDEEIKANEMVSDSPAAEEAAASEDQDEAAEATEEDAGEDESSESNDDGEAESE